MRRPGWLLPLLLLMARESAPAGLLQVQLLEWAPGAGSGEFSYRDAGHRVRWCTYSAETCFERDGTPASATDIQAGSRVEFVADWRGDPEKCHALLLRVVAPPRGHTNYHIDLAPYRRLLEHIAPLGSITFAGVVLRADGERFLLRTRAQGYQTLRLRADTRYASGGRAADAGILEASARVFVRAGRGLDGELEAYYVVRGQILRPGGFQSER